MYINQKKKKKQEDQSKLNSTKPEKDQQKPPLDKFEQI